MSPFRISTLIGLVFAFHQASAAVDAVTLGQMKGDFRARVVNIYEDGVSDNFEGTCKVSANIALTETEFSYWYSYFDCGAAVFNDPQYFFKIRNGVVYHNGKAVGTVTSDGGVLISLEWTARRTTVSYYPKFGNCELLDLEEKTWSLNRRFVLKVSRLESGGYHLERTFAYDELYNKEFEVTECGDRTFTKKTMFSSNQSMSGDLN